MVKSILNQVEKIGECINTPAKLNFKTKRYFPTAQYK